MALRRRDNGQGVVLDLDTSRVPPDVAMRSLLPKVAARSADQEEQARFAALWQDRVARMLVDHADGPELVRVTEWQVAA